MRVNLLDAEDQYLGDCKASPGRAISHCGSRLIRARSPSTVTDP